MDIRIFAYMEVKSQEVSECCLGKMLEYSSKFSLHNVEILLKLLGPSPVSVPNLKKRFPWATGGSLFSREKKECFEIQ